jgi:hypothetical protein
LDFDPGRNPHPFEKKEATCGRLAPHSRSVLSFGWETAKQPRRSRFPFTCDTLRPPRHCLLPFPISSNSVYSPGPCLGSQRASPATQPLQEDGREIPCPARPHLASVKQRSRCLPPPSPSPRRAVIITSSLFLLRSLGKEPENSNSSCRGRLSYKTLRWVALRLATTPKKAPVLPARTWRAQQRPPPPKPEAQALPGAKAVAKGTSGPSPPPRPQCPYHQLQAPFIHSQSRSGCPPGLGGGETQVAPHCPTRVPLWPGPRAAPPYPASRSGEFHTSASLLHPGSPCASNPAAGRCSPEGPQRRTPEHQPSLGLFSRSRIGSPGASYPQRSHSGRALAGPARSTAPSLPRRHSPLSAQVPASRSPRPRASRTFLRADILGLS